MSQSISVRLERPQDVPRIRAMNIAAFGTAAEADIVELLRADTHNTVSLIAEEDGGIVGHIMFSPVQIAGGFDLPAMALAPMAVSPHRQRAGIGSELVRAGLDHCRQAGVSAVFVVGHPSYYPRFGFARASTFGFSCEFDVPDDVFMAMELIPGALARGAGTVHFHKAFKNA